MRKTLRLLFILSVIIMTACHNNEQEIDISWTQEAARVVHDGINTNFEHKEKNYKNFKNSDYTRNNVIQHDTF